MKITGFGSFDFAGTGYFCSVPAGQVPIASVRHTLIQRVGAPAAYGSAVIPERRLPIVFGVYDLTLTGAATFEDAFANLFERLESTNPTPRQLRALRNDGTTAQAINAVLNINPVAFSDAVNAFEGAEFVLTDPLWTALTETTLTKTFNSGLDQAMAVAVAGNGETPLKLRVQPTAQRAAPTATIGWRYRRIATVANNGDRPFVRMPVFIDLGDTTPLTTTKAQADGDDVIAVIDGKQVPRTLRNWDAASNSGLWVIVEFLAAGESMEVEVWYGNASATAPATLSTIPDGATTASNFPAFDLASSLNTSLVYPTDDTSGNDLLGIWGVVDGQTADYQRPGAWAPDMTCPNRGNRDDVAQRPVTEYVATGTRHRATFDAERSRDGGRNPAGNREADGVVFAWPLPITRVNVGFAWENDFAKGGSGDPVGKLMFLARPNGAAEWTPVTVDSSTDATPTTIAAANYDPAAGTYEVGFAVWPFDSVAVVRNAAKNRKVESSFNTNCTVTIDATDLSISLAAEVEVYELATSLTLHEDGRRRRYRKIQLGGGGSNRRLAVPLNNQLVVYPDSRRIEEWNSGLTALVRTVPPTAYAVLQAILDAEGVQSEVASDAWPAVFPYTNPLANFAFTADILNWDASSTTGGLTVTRSWDNTVGGVALGSYKIDITANAAGAGASAASRSGAFIPLNGRSWVSVAAFTQTAHVNLRPQIGIVWYTEAGAVVSGNNDSWTPAATATPYRRLVAAKPPATATQFKVQIANVAITAGQTGAVWFDDVTVNGPEIVLADDAIGTIDLDALYHASYP